MTGSGDMPAYVKQTSTAGDAAVVRRPVPRAGPGQVLVRVAGCGICGSDLHAVRSDPGYEFVRAPVVLGHEFSGTVEAAGSGVGSVAPGDRVVGVSIQGCGSCRACRRGETQICPGRTVIGIQYDGALAEYVAVAEQHLVRIPDGLDLTVAALAEPLSVAVHAVLDRSVIRPGDRVVVSGPGTIGLLCGRLATLSGAAVLMLGTTADSRARLPMAARFGMRTADVQEIDAAGAVRDHTAGAGADVWIEASGAIPSMHSAIGGVRRGGIVTVVAMYAREMTFAPTTGVRGELSLLFSYGSRYDDYVTALGLLADGSVDGAALVSTFPLDQAPAAFDAATGADVVKAVIVP